MPVAKVSSTMMKASSIYIVTSYHTTGTSSNSARRVMSNKAHPLPIPRRWVVCIDLFGRLKQPRWTHKRASSAALDI